MESCLFIPEWKGKGLISCHASTQTSLPHFIPLEVLSVEGKQEEALERNGITFLPILSDSTLVGSHIRVKHHPSLGAISMIIRVKTIAHSWAESLLDEMEYGFIFREESKIKG